MGEPESPVLELLNGILFAIIVLGLGAFLWFGVLHQGSPDHG